MAGTEGAGGEWGGVVENNHEKFRVFFLSESVLKIAGMGGGGGGGGLTMFQKF